MERNNDLNTTVKRKSDEYMTDAASLRDRERIIRLKRQYNLSKPEDVEKLNSLLLSGSIRFETPVGDEFDDEVYELNKQLKQGKKLPDIGSKSNIKNKKENIKREKNNKSVNNTDDPYLDKLAEKELVRQNRMRNLAVILLSLAAAGCIGYFLFYYYSQDQSEKRFSVIKELVGSDALKGKTEKTTVTATLTNGETKVYQVLDKYQSVFNSNQRLIGWIQIADTNIDYPVMQCEDNTYYLSHNFDSEEDKAGALFLDCNNSIVSDDDNYIIYGHHLTSGRMFSSLGEYEKESYYNKHKYIVFDTIYEEHTYQVMYAFRSRVYNEDDVVFKYYQFINANSEEEFNSYMAEMKGQSFYDTGVTAVYGDTLLTLSTCDYHEENGRFVVVARRIK